MGANYQMTDEDRGIERRDKAMRVVENLGVKQHRFLPSGRTVWTVVGKEGDVLVDLDNQSKPYCSCDDFHFRVLGSKIAECYHLIAARKAMAEGLYATIDFNDEEYRLFIRALISDLFANVS